MDINGLLSLFIFFYIFIKSIANDIYYSSSLENLNFTYYTNLNTKISLVKKNLLIGAFIKYEWQIIEPFFLSFIKAGFENCECVMFIKKISESTLNKIKSLDIIVHEIPDKYTNISIINLRWKIYEDFLKDNIDKYNLVFTADLRDCFFQLDVFKFYNSSQSFLGMAIEDGTLSENINKNWIINAYGSDLHETIKDERIICVGTIWGTPDKFLEFSSKMWEKLSSNWSLTNNVIEQAVTNYLIYHDKMFNNCLLKSDNKDGRVMTIALTRPEDIRIDSQNNILNGNGEIAAVIHQYDRKPNIVNIVRNKFHLEMKKEGNNIFNIVNKKLNDNFKESKEKYKSLKIFISYVILIIFCIFFILLIIFYCLIKKKFKIFNKSLFPRKKLIKRNKIYKKMIII